MEGTTEKDCSPLWSLYQQIVADMKNSAPMWEEFISKATKLHSALKSALVAVAAFLDAFQKIADAATNARGATKEIGTALTRVCLRHRAIETRMKTFISTLMERLITPLSERADEWRRGCNTGALGREHARECKRARAELRRRMHEAQRQTRKARRATPDMKRRNDVSMQDIQERQEQLEEMEEKAVKAAFIEERSRFCHFVSLLNPVVESEVAMLAEVGHLQEGTEQLARHTSEPRSLPPASLQVICDVKCCSSGWGSGTCPSPVASRVGSRKSSLTSICSLSVSHSERRDSQSCSTPVSNASSGDTTPAPPDDSLNGITQSPFRMASVCSSDSGFRSQDALQRPSLYVDNGSDNQSVNSECLTTKTSDDQTDDGHDIMNAASATWPDLKDTAQFERAASAIMGGRPHTISAGSERIHGRPALSVHTFTPTDTPRDTPIYARPPLPTRCSSLERPIVPSKSNCMLHSEMKPKPSSLPPHLTKEMPQALYVNMSELATMAASRAQQHNSEFPQQEKVCSESSASESSLESSSGYGSQGAFAAEDHGHHQPSHPDAPTVWSRRGSSSSVGKPPPPVRRSSSISRPQRPYVQNVQNQVSSNDADNLPPPPAFLLQPDHDANTAPAGINVAETVKQLTELKHMPASPGLLRRTINQNVQNQNYDSQLSTFHQAKNNFSGNLNPIYGQTGHRIVEFENSVYARKNSLNSSHSDLFRDGHTGHMYGEIKESQASTPSTPSVGENSFTSFGPRVHNDSHYGQTGFKLKQETRFGGIYAQPGSTRSHSADRHAATSGLIASLSAKLGPQLSPRTGRRTISSITPADGHKPKTVPAVIQPAFLDKLSATIQNQRRQLSTTRASTVRDLINTHAQPDPRVCHTSLMEQIKRGATLRRNKLCNDRSAPKIR
ncbi:protein MTSS 2 isoform X5 [Pieris rapae]|uniref:protein MTSS 2 isoform X5 n=1 Tax=Pieris rapae TaxID=64459 RepID=UPI000B92892E|nr:protein MTSS 2 isoform X5 [Pieris rapae]